MSFETLICPKKKEKKSNSLEKQEIKRHNCTPFRLSLILFLI